MKSNLEGVVYLAGSCYYNMIRSIIEPLPKESSGDLIGRRYKDSFLLVNSYPHLNVKRKRWEVLYEDDRAIERLRKIDKSLNKLRGLGNHSIGGYHSHINSKEERIVQGLSKDDLIEHISSELKELNRKYWMEIVLNIRDKKYSQPKKTGEHFIIYPKKLRVILRDAPSHSYDIIISAYFVDKKLKVRELRVRRKARAVQNI